MTPRAEEEKTIRLMIALYCRAAHGHPRRAPLPVCEDCTRLADYAAARLGRCPWGDEKPTCARCPTHCYKPDMRDAVRQVMRFSGPRMLFYHPTRGIRHVLKGLRSVPSTSAPANPPSTSAPPNPPSTSAPPNPPSTSAPLNPPSTSAPQKGVIDQ